MEFYTASALEKVFFDGKGVRKTACGSMLKNERYNFQLVVCADKRKMGRITVEGDLSEHCLLREVGFVNALESYHNGKKDDYYIFPEDYARSYPDILRPLEGEILLAQDSCHSVWVTVFAKDGLKAGKHELTFTLTLDGGEEYKTSFALDVIDAELPKSNLKYTNWVHYDSIAEYYGIKPWTKEFYNTLGWFLDSAVAHGMNVLYTPLFTPPLDTAVGAERMDVQLVGITEKDGEYSFDFTRLDEFIDFAKGRGIEFFEMCHLATQWGAKACPKIMANTPSGYRRIFGWDTPSAGEEYKRFLTVFLSELDGYLKNKGIADCCFFHISDEPAKEHYEDFRRVFDFIRPLIKDYKVMDATGKTGMDLLDVPVIAIDCVDESFDSEKCWVYNCCGQCDRYTSNRFVNMPSQRNRVLGLQLYKSGVKGFLHWGFNYYRNFNSIKKINPFATCDGEGSWPGGDPFIVYPAENGVYDSLRHEVLYDGFQDRSALMLLEKYIGKDAVMELLETEGLKSWFEYPRSADWHLGFRAKVNALIADNLKKN